MGLILWQCDHTSHVALASLLITGERTHDTSGAQPLHVFWFWHSPATPSAALPPQN